MLTDHETPETPPPGFLQELLRSPELARQLKLSDRARPPLANPFIAGLELDARKKRAGTTEVSVITDAETGARLGFQQEDIFYVDNARFVKVMAKMLSAAFDMDGAGQRLFFLLLDAVSEAPGQDEIYLSWAQRMTIGEQEALITRRSFYRGIKTLKEAQFIAPSDRGKGWYWINPAYFFNGDRVRFINTFVRANPDLPEAKRPRVRYPEDKKPREKKKQQIGKPEA